MNLTGNRVVRLPLGTVANIDLPIVLAIDPGTTTGYAWYDPWTGKVTCGQLGPALHHLALTNLISELLAYGKASGREQLHLVCEQFEFRQSEEAVREALRRYVALLKTETIRSLSSIIGSLTEILEVRNSRDNLVLDSRNYIGVCELAAQTFSGVTLYSQSASTAKFFIKNNKLEAMGWYNQTAAMTHARDALRHLLRHMVATLNVKEPITTMWFSKSGTR